MKAIQGFVFFLLTVYASSAFAHIKTYAYVGARYHDAMLIIDTDLNQVVASISGVSPVQIKYSEKNKNIYVLNYDNSISVIDISSYGILATIPSNNIYSSVFFLNHSETTAYIYDGVTFVAVNLKSNSISAKISVGNLVNASSSAIAINSSDTIAYVANGFKNSISVVDLNTNIVIAEIKVGNQPTAVALSKDGAFAYVINTGDNTVSVVNVATNSVVGTINVGSNPRRVAMNGVGTYVYVSNYGDKSTSIIDTTTNKVVGSLAGANQIYIDSSGMNGYMFCNSGAICEVDLHNNSLKANIPLNFVSSQDPQALVFDPAGNFAYILNGWDAAFAVVDLNLKSMSSKLTNFYISNDFPRLEVGTAQSTSPRIRISQVITNGVGSLTYNLTGLTGFASTLTDSNTIPTDTVTSSFANVQTTSSSLHLGVNGGAATVEEVIPTIPGTSTPIYTINDITCVDENSANDGLGNIQKIVGSGNAVSIPGGYMVPNAKWNCSFVNTQLTHLAGGELSALIDLYNHTNGPTWIFQTNWPVGDPCVNFWYGIRCDASYSHVVEIDLESNGLDGTLPPSIFALPSLKQILIDENGLSGPLPSMSGLSSLQSFFADNNFFVGQLPLAPNTLVRGESNLCPNALVPAGNPPSANDQSWSVATLTDISGGWSQACSLSILPSPLLQLAAVTTEGVGAFEFKLTNAVGISGGYGRVNAATLVGTDSISTNSANTSTTSTSVFVMKGGSPATIVQASGGGNFSSLYKCLDYNAAIDGVGSMSPISGSGASIVLSSSLQVPGSFWRCTITNSPVGPAEPAFVDPNQFGITGIWYNPLTSGQGLLTKVYKDLPTQGTGTLFAGWYTYSSDGTRLDWYTLQGGVASNLPMTTVGIYRAIAGNHNPSGAAVAAQVGTATLTFNDCSHMAMSYTLFEGSHRSGSMPLVRLDANNNCSATGDVGNYAGTSNQYSGAWYDPTTSGEGFVFEFSPQQTLFFAGWYKFDANAMPIWYTIQAPWGADATSGTDMPIYASAGGVFDNSTPIAASQVGSASLSLLSCSFATLTYSFTGGPDAGKNGVIALRPVGAPSPLCR